MYIRFGKCFDVATLRSQVSLLHLVYVSGLLLLTSLALVTTAQTCPAEPPNCSCKSTSDFMETEIQCLNLGNLSQFFHLGNDNRTILRVNITGITTISRIQDGAFGDLKIREIR